MTTLEDLKNLICEIKRITGKLPMELDIGFDEYKSLLEDKEFQELMSDGGIYGFMVGFRIPNQFECKIYPPFFPSLYGESEDKNEVRFPWKEIRHDIETER